MKKRDILLLVTPELPVLWGVIGAAAMLVLEGLFGWRIPSGIRIPISPHTAYVAAGVLAAYAAIALVARGIQRKL